MPEPRDARYPFQDHAVAADGVFKAITITPDYPAMALVISRACADDLRDRFAEAFGIAPPPLGQRRAVGERAIVSVGPRKWLAMGYSGGGIASMLTEKLETVASVTDQSDAFGVLRVSGRHVREMMAKAVGIDLSPVAFGRDSATATMLALMRVQISRTDDLPTYEIAVARSMADSLVGHLTNYAREFSVSVRQSQQVSSNENER